MFTLRNYFLLPQTLNPKNRKDADKDIEAIEIVDLSVDNEDAISDPAPRIAPSQSLSESSPLTSSGSQTTTSSASQAAAASSNS